MFIKKALLILAFFGLLLPFGAAAEEPLPLRPEISRHMLPDPKIYSGETYYLPIFMCQDEDVAREILHAWWEHGEVIRDFLMHFASITRGGKVPGIVDCIYYDGFIIPIRNLGLWPNLPETTMYRQGFVSVTLIEVELFILFDDQPHKFYGFLPNDAVASR